MKTNQVIQVATQHLNELNGHIFDLLSIEKPVSPEAAVNLAKIISKLSPLLGNMIEFNTCEFLNQKDDFKPLGNWLRQDPGFPDIIFDGGIVPTPGFEIKAWFPLATEITGRFKDSQTHFSGDQTHVALIAWLPEFLIYGKPKIIGIAVSSGASLACARDEHYHKPPGYLVLEPQDTKARTKNLQQTNTAGYKWQASTNVEIESQRQKEAADLLASWGNDSKKYSPSADYQQKLNAMKGRFNYRLDTNFAKLDRIGHPQVQAFAKSIYTKEYHGKTIGEWSALLSSKNTKTAKGEAALKAALIESFGIGVVDVEEALVK